MLAESPAGRWIVTMDTGKQTALFARRSAAPWPAPPRPSRGRASATSLGCAAGCELPWQGGSFPVEPQGTDRIATMHPTVGTGGRIDQPGMRSLPRPTLQHVLGNRLRKTVERVTSPLERPLKTPTTLLARASRPSGTGAQCANVH